MKSNYFLSFSYPYLNYIRRVKADLALNTSFLNNFISLLLIQGMNYLIAFFITPYIVRKLGPENFGLVSFSQAYILYFTLIINFGFDFTATRDIARCANNIEVDKIFSEVFYSKILLFFVSSIIFLTTILLSEELNANWELHLSSHLMNVGFVLFPQWLFQGLNRMKAAMYITLISRILMLICIILLVQDKNDFIIYNFIYSIFNVFLGFVAFVYLIKTKVIRLCRITFSYILKKLKASFTVFMSLAVYSIYTSSNIVLLGFLSSKVSTGYFSCAAKLITICLSVIFVPFATVLFPRISKKLEVSYDDGIHFLKKISWITLALGISLSAITFFNAEYLILVFYGNEYAPAVKCLQFLSLLPFFTSLSNVFAVQGLLNLKMDKHFLAIMLIVAFVSITLNLILIPKLNEIGVCISWNIAELFYLLISGYFLTKKIGFPLNIKFISFHFK